MNIRERLWKAAYKLIYLILSDHADYYKLRECIVLPIDSLTSNIELIITPATHNVWVYQPLYAISAAFKRIIGRPPWS